jgi:hypothetical protein
MQRFFCGLDKGGNGDPALTLLAVDAGLKTGIALFDRDGRLRWCRSRNLGRRERLRRAIRGLLDELPELETLVVEGGGAEGDLWEREGRRRGLRMRRIAAETWREALLLPRERRDAGTAKRAAVRLARRVHGWSGLSGPSTMRHDAAEAVLVGLFAAIEAGWLSGPPDGLR